MKSCTEDASSFQMIQFQENAIFCDILQIMSSSVINYRLAKFLLKVKGKTETGVHSVYSCLTHFIRRLYDEYIYAFYS